MKLNNFFIALLVVAIVILLVIGVYEILFKPPEYEINTRVDNVSTNFGEDVLEAIE